MTNQELIDRLSQLPEEISSESHHLVKLTVSLQEKNTAFKQSEMEIKLEIADEMDANGKKVYSNAESREAALVERIKTNESMVELQLEIKQVEVLIQTVKVVVEQLSNEQRNIRSIMQFIASGALAEI
jgi:SPX domain protein involved in polyphosphate accumulation